MANLSQALWSTEIAPVFLDVATLSTAPWNQWSFLGRVARDKYSLGETGHQDHKRS